MGPISRHFCGVVALLLFAMLVRWLLDLPIRIFAHPLRSGAAARNSFARLQMTGVAPNLVTALPQTIVVAPSFLSSCSKDLLWSHYVVGRLQTTGTLSPNIGSYYSRFLMLDELHLRYCTSQKNGYPKLQTSLQGRLDAHCHLGACGGGGWVWKRCQWRLCRSLETRLFLCGRLIGTSLLGRSPPVVARLFLHGLVRGSVETPVGHVL